MPFDPVYRLLAALPLPALPETASHWAPGQSPMSTNLEVFEGLALYLILIFGGQKLMEERKPMKLKKLFLAHNILLSVGSGLLLAVMVEEIAPMLFARGPLHSICSAEAWTSKLEMAYIINYGFKWLELLDTVFLVAKKKPLKFLHVFHHANTALLCYVQLNGRTSVSWVPIVLNLGVHVLMYYYYAMSSVGHKIWWKKYLTTLQITQFVIDLAVVYFASYTLLVSRYASKALPHYGTCVGTEGAAFFGCALLTSYLFLFISFYKATYDKKPASGGTPLASALKKPIDVAPGEVGLLDKA